MRVSETAHCQFEIPFLSFVSWWSAFLSSRRASWHGGKDCSVGPLNVDLLPFSCKGTTEMLVTAAVLEVMVIMWQRKKLLGPAADLPSRGPWGFTAVGTLARGNRLPC